MDQQNSDIESTPAKPDDQQISSSPSDKQTSQLKPLTISGFPKRYVLLLMIFIGFVNIYAMRVNLNVALVAMVNNQTIIKGGVSIVKVHETSPLCVWSSYLDRCAQLTVLYAQNKLRPARLRGLWRKKVFYSRLRCSSLSAYFLIESTTGLHWFFLPMFYDRFRKLMQIKKKEEANLKPVVV